MNKQAVPNALRSMPGKIENGGSNPRFYEFDDGVTRLVKWNPSIHGKCVCFNELVASRIAQLFDVPLLRGCVVFVSDDIIPADQKAYAKEGFHFGVYRMKGSNYVPHLHEGIIENAAEFPIAAIQLAWLQVADQETHNQYKQELQDEDDPTKKRYLYRLADMGFMFGIGNVGVWDASSLGKSDKYSLPSHLTKHVKAEQLAAVIKEVEAIPEHNIRDCFNDIPEDWKIAPADVSAAIDWVLAARQKLKALIEKGNPSIKFEEDKPVKDETPPAGAPNV